MNVNGTPYRTIWLKPDDPETVQVIDQRNLPHEFNIEDIRSVGSMARAVQEMHVRGAGLIGAAAGYGMYLATLEASKAPSFQDAIVSAYETLNATRPTAVNLVWALDRQLDAIGEASEVEAKIDAARRSAQEIANEDAEFCRKIGEHGLQIIQQIANEKPGEPINILTHCNAGWLAFVDHGSATAPIYAAHDAGLPVHVYVDETRPRNQGARLTAWELGQHGVPHTLIADNVGGHLMQHGLVDLVLTGTDRTAVSGDVANKIGTYLKALAAKDNDVPFYVALPSSTFDWTIQDGVRDIPIEQRGGEEVSFAKGLCDGQVKRVQLSPESSPTANYAFDVTPARLVTGLITERGICQANEESIRALFPEK